MMIRALVLLIIIGSSLVLLPKVMAQTPSEGAKVLVDDVIQATQKQVMCM
jgi:hypothetical protein